MSVDGCRQSVVVVLVGCEGPTAEIHCLHHAAGRKDPQHCVEERVVGHDGGIERVRERLAATHIHVEALQTKTRLDCLTELRLYVPFNTK